MGRALARRFPGARRIFEEADDRLGFSLSRIAWEGPEEKLTLTTHAQLAILVHSLAVHEVLQERLGEVAAAAGHSLGEFSAHVSAGTLSFADALEVVRVRGDRMLRAGRERPGTMAAVIGLPPEEVETLCAAGGRGGVCVAANFNAPGQVVVSGEVEAVERAAERAREKGAKRVVPLRVSGAFHSPLMGTARDALAGKLARVAFRDPRFPVFSNVTAEPVRSGERARELLVRQLVSPVRWSESLRAMAEAGVSEWIEAGPGRVLCGLNRRNRIPGRCRSVGEPEALEKMEVLR